MMPIGEQKPNFSSQVEVIQGVPDLANGFGADMGVDLRGLRGTVAQQGLNIAQVGALLQEVRGEGVPEGVHGGGGGDARLRLGLLEDGLDTGIGIGPTALAFEKEELGPVFLHVRIELGEHFGAKERDPVLAAFTAADHHLLPVRIDVGAPKVDQFTEPQPCRVDEHEDALMLQVAH